MPFRYGDVFKKAKSDDGSSADELLDSHEEVPKTIITQSIPALLRRCSVHILPIAISILIMTLNIKGTYLGADLMSPVKSETINLLLLQLAAKAHEITIVASLGVVVLQFVRHELLFGDGLPLGLLGSGITFNHFEFFFRKEFYGGLKYVAGHGNKPRKVMLVGLVVVSGLVAALAGPASAVLLVPKSQDWKAGGTKVFLNGAEDQFWPDDLSGNMSELEQLCAGDKSTRLGFCPGGGFYSLWTHWGTMNMTNFRTQDVRSYAKDLSGSRFYWPNSSPSLIPPLYALGDNQRGPNGRTALTQPHAATVVVLQKLAEDWWDALTTLKDLTPNQVDDRLVSAKFKHAMTIARCAPPQELNASDKTVQFPSINGHYNDFTTNLPLEVDSLSETRVNHLRFQWVALPSNFGPASIGGVFEAPWHKTKETNASRAVFGCTMQAGWVPATAFTDKYTFWTGWYPWDILFGDRTPAWDSRSDNLTNGRIAMGKSWLDLLTPQSPITVTDTGSWRPSTIESIFLNAGLASHLNQNNGRDMAVLDDWMERDYSTWARISLVETIICSVILDGLSRVGSHRVFDTSGSASEWAVADYNPLPDFASRVLKNQPAVIPPTLNSDEYIAIDAEMKTSGFSFQASLASFLAMSVLLVHAVLACGHITYVVRKRQTSRSWSSVAELIALSLNSQPASDILANTGGGIRRSMTYSQVAKIRARATPGNPDQEHVELLFENSSASPDLAGSTAGLEMNKLREGSLRHPSTWPRSQASICLSTSDGVYDDLSISTERLAPQVSISDEKKISLVKVDYSYG